MMVDDFTHFNQELNAHRNDDTTEVISQSMNPSIHLISALEPTTHLDTNSSDTINVVSTSNNSTSSSSTSDQQIDLARTSNNNLHHPSQFTLDDQHNQHQVTQPNYFTIDPNTNYSTNNINSGHHFDSIANSVTSPPVVKLGVVEAGIQAPSQHQAGNMNTGDTSQHGSVIPTAHGSEQQIQYSVPITKNLLDSSRSNVALNFSHDLLQQSSHHNHQSTLHQPQDNTDNKHQFDLDSGSLMQSAAVGMNMWKNSMSLNHFKHPVISDHNFLPSSDLNSFPVWPHGNNLGHQPSSMTHHIIDSQHLIGYPQHPRSIPMPSQDRGVGGLMKNQSTVEQASFMLNSINHQASTSQNSSSNHHTTQPLDNLNLRSSHPLDHSTSYNLSLNDNQFYNSSRSEPRSHPNANKSSFMDRSAHVSLAANHQSNIAYHNPEHGTLQPTSSHHVAGTSSGTSSLHSKNEGTFSCSTCKEVFTLRTQYQIHIKTHSQDKAAKAKFSCELCGHSFSQKTSLNRHHKSHTGERPFPCTVCNKAFSEKERLKIHTRTHTGEKPFSCSICGKSFSQKSTVKRHQTVHTGEKKFKCNVCGRAFSNRGNLAAHCKTRGPHHN